MEMQIKKNTVPSKNQCLDSDYIKFMGDHAGTKIAFVGNSITLHNIAPQIGWNRECGMAASCLENDYVHRIMAELMDKNKAAGACICNAAQWEINYKDGKGSHVLYQRVRDYEPDILVMRIIENCNLDEFEQDTFLKSYKEFVDYLTNEHTKIIFTTGFWKHPGDLAIKEAAKQKNSPCIYLGDLGELEEMKAIGLYEHSGVANHPCDLGMYMIGERILEVINKFL